MSEVVEQRRAGSVACERHDHRWHARCVIRHVGCCYVEVLAQGFLPPCNRSWPVLAHERSLVLSLAVVTRLEADSVTCGEQNIGRSLTGEKLSKLGLDGGLTNRGRYVAMLRRFL